MRRISAIAAATAALLLGACNGGDDGQGTTPAGAPHPIGAGPDETTTAAPPTTTTGTPTAPASAGDSSSGAPDSGISTRPGGPSGGY
jgi:hypothetical protein